MIGLITTALARTRTTLLLFTLLIISGLVSFFNISKESFPDVQIPIVYVFVGMEGVSPEDADSMIVSPLYKELKTLEGLKQISSTASEGHASVTMEFEADADIDQALVDVREATDTAKGELPAAADEPTVNEVNLSKMPVVKIALSGNLDERVLKSIAEDLQEEIEGLPEVLEANITGTREEMAEIVVDPALMASYNLSHSELISLVTSNNQLVTAGNMDTGAGRFAVKVPGLIENEEDILNLPVKVDGDTVVTFSDIAIGQRTYKDRENISRVDGEPAVVLEVSKRVGENIIDTIDKVKEVVYASEEFWPEGLSVVFTQDQSSDVRTQLKDLYNSVILSTLLVFIVVVWALGPTNGLLVGIAIPSSFLTGILALSMMGLTINMVVLFGLIMSVGMLVDGAIVVTEYADRRMNEGASRLVAYREAATRMAWPIIASTATTLAVFMPLLFWPGIMGEFMKYLPLTVLMTLSASLVMALIAVPTFGYLFGRPSPVSESQKLALQAASHGDLDKLTGMTGRYVKALKFLVMRPLYVMFYIILLVVLIFVAYGRSGLGTEFFPEFDENYGSVAVRARGNLSLEERDVLVKTVEQRVLGMPEVKSVYTYTDAARIREYPDDAIGIVQLEFVDWQERRRTKVILEEIVANTTDIPGIHVEKHVEPNGPAAGVDIQLEFISYDLNLLKETVSKISNKLSANPKMIDVSDNLPLDGIEWEIDVDREQASRFGTSLQTVGSSIQMITGGLNIGTYRPDNSDDELDIRMRYPFNGRSLDQIDNLTITAGGQQVPISNFVERIPRNKKGEIYRIDGTLTFKVEANVIESERQDLVIAELRDELAAMYASGEISPEVTFKFVGNQEDQEEAGQFLVQAFGVAFFIMIIILVSQFNSFYQTGLILSAVGLSTVGVFLGLLVTRGQFGIVMSGVGVISLAGIVVNNNIVLIDTFNVIRKQGVPAVEAVLMTGAQRLRPVILTTVTTILGLIPMVTQLNIDLIAGSYTVGAPSTGMWSQLATAIAGGLTFATVLTLVATPTLLVLKAQREDRKKMRLEAASQLG